MPDDPFLLFPSLLSPREVALLLQSPVRKESGASLLDIVTSPSSNYAFLDHATERGKGRVDFALNRNWEREASSSLTQFRKVKNVVRRIAEGKQSKSVSVQWHVMVVSPGAKEQEWHKDAPGKRVYSTFLLPLTRDPPSSGTEFKGRGRGKTEVANPFGGGILFDGKVAHRGTSHPGPEERIFLYAAIFAGSDPNA